MRPLSSRDLLLAGATFHKFGKHISSTCHVEVVSVNYTHDRHR